MMKRSKAILLSLLFLVMLIPASHAQDLSTQGKEFWLSFISNGFKYHPDIPPSGWVRVQLLVSAKRSCEGTILNPNTGWRHDFTVEANNIFSIDLEEEQVYIENYEYEQIVNKGLMITTTDTVSVYCANIATYSFDASYVLPTQGLGADYIIQTHEQSTGSYDPTSAFVIVATEDNTTVDITPKVKTLDNKPAGQEFSITLNKGQAYQVRSNDDFMGNRDLSGTRVTSRDCKPIAIFNGNNLTLVPNSATSDQDCIFEQAMPIHSWGKKFIVTSSLDRNNDYVKITSAADNNEIYKNGTMLCTLNTGQSYSFELRSWDQSCYLEASQSCAVYLYNTSSNGSNTGAPSMLWIAPVEQRIDAITFSTFNYNHNNVNITNHYVNIIVETQDIDQVYLDGTLLDADLFSPVTGNSDYSFYRKNISHGVHHLSCPNGFNAHVYGFGRARGYAYMVGSKATDLSTILTIDDVVVNHGDTLTHCTLAPMNFEADINYSNYEVLWNLGDGSTSTATSFVHTYSEHKIYEVSFTITTQENPCAGSTSVTTVFYIDMQNAPGQDIFDELCFSGPGVYNENGFNLPYDAPGVYTASQVFPTENGCDSIVNLTLDVNEIIEGGMEHVSGHCDTFEWNGNTYTASGIYNDTVTNPSGCYTIYHLDLDLDFTPNPTDIYPTDPANTAPHWVVTATEFQINSYDYTLHDINPECEWDTVIWSLEDDVTWVIEPFGPKTQSCKIYVLNQVEDTVWLHAKVINECHPEGIDRRYWLVCSFYGIEDNGGPSTGSGTAGTFDVVPNPNKGQMTLELKHLTGDINLKVYDMRGTLVDERHFLNHDDAYSLSYALPQTAPGIYLFTLHAKEGAMTKKVILLE